MRGGSFTASGGGGMTKNIRVFQKNKFSLLVSLPKNAADFAKAAEDGGAHGIKAHLNVKHRASKTFFGSFAQEKKNIEKIIKTVSCPVGVMPGADVAAPEDEMEMLQEMGISFFDIYIHHAPTFLLKSTLFKMFAIDRFDTDALRDVHELKALRAIDAVEASIVNPADYGKRLNAQNVAHYSALSRYTKLPVIVPTQKAVRPDEVQILYEAGVKMLMIGAVVTGKEIKGFEQKVRAYRNAIDAL